MPSLLHDKRASVAVVVAMITIAVAIIIGLVVTGTLSSVADGFNLGTQGNATRTSLFTQTYNAYNLVVVLVIVLAAGAVISGLSLARGVGG